MEKSELLNYIKSSPEKAFRYILSEHKEQLYWHIRKMVLNHEDANDITQEAFIKIWSNLHKYKGNAQIYTWIYRIATNLCLTFLEKEKKHQIEKLETQHILGSTELEKTYDEIIKILLHALGKLPPKQRLVFNLKYFDNMKYNEIAMLTGNSIGSLKASYHLAVKKIEPLLKHSTLN